jgi:flavodoxin I
LQHWLQLNLDSTIRQQHPLLNKGGIDLLMQSDWSGFYDDDLDSVDFSGKKVAYFGAGDQIGYADNFQDAMGILEEKISELGGTTVGYWSTEGYEHSESKAVKDGKFVGLALDEDNQSDLTDERVKTWVAQLKSEFGL